MNLFLRLFAVLISVAFRRHLKVDDVSQITLLVLPNDLDLNFHMNNGRYLTLLDLGRLDFLIRAGLGPVLLRNKWQPLIGGTLIRYRFGLRPFERFSILTRILCWDEKWFYFEQHFVTNRGTATVVLSKVSVRDRNGTIAPDLILEAVKMRQPSPEVPDAVSRWVSAEETLHIEE